MMPPAGEPRRSIFRFPARNAVLTNPVGGRGLRGSDMSRSIRFHSGLAAAAAYADRDGHENREASEVPQQVQTQSQGVLLLS